MGLYDEITADLAEAFDSDLADAVITFKAIRVAKGSYNPSVGRIEEAHSTYSGRGVFGSYALALIDGESILATDQKLTALQSEVTDTPQINDTINDSIVINVSKDPANVSWIIQLRA